MLERVRHRTRGFSALELMAAAVIVGLIAAASYAAVRPALDTSFDRSVTNQIEQVHRLAWSNAAAERRVGIRYADLDDPTPGAPELAGTNPTSASDRQGRLSAGIYGDGTQMALAMLSRSGNCIGLFAHGRTVLAAAPLDPSSGLLCTASRALDELVGDSYTHNGRTIARAEMVEYTPPGDAPSQRGPDLITQQTEIAGQPAVRLSWTAVDAPGGLTGYTIERDGAVLASVSRTAVDYVDDTVVTGGVYSYLVRPNGADGNGTASLPVALTVRSFRAPQVSVTDLSTAVDAQLEIAWTVADAPGGLTGYQVWRDATLLTPDPLGVGVSRFLDTTAEDGRVYSYVVVALGSASGSTVPSAPVSGSATLAP